MPEQCVKDLRQPQDSSGLAIVGLAIAIASGIIGFLIGRRSVPPPGERRRAVIKDEQAQSGPETLRRSSTSTSPTASPGGQASPAGIQRSSSEAIGRATSHNGRFGDSCNSCKNKGSWERKKLATTDDESAVRIRFVHINDVYTLENLPRLRTFLFDIARGLPIGNLVVSVGGDILSPYPLSALDQGKGMVDVLLQCGVRYACFGNHEADVGLHALRARIEQWTRGGGVWINTNMPDLLPELKLPTFSEIVAFSRDQEESRCVCLLGVCTGESGLYVPPDDFGGAVRTAENCNDSAKRVAQTLMARSNPSEEGHADQRKVDAVVVLTHQDTTPDIELAATGFDNGISLVLGGHDHEEYLEEYNSCLMAKAGMDAHKVVVVDLVWPTPADATPVIDLKELLPLMGYAKNKPVARVAQGHMQKVWDLEKLKGAIALTSFKKAALMSSKRIRQEQTTMGTLLCDGMRTELAVDCVLLDGGNIRGDRQYIPHADHWRGGEVWAFTMADLEHELPWPSEIVVVPMYGSTIAAAIAYSRSRLPALFGGFLQTDAGLVVSAEDQTIVTHVAGEVFDPERLYRVALMHSSLSGMNDNPAFTQWREFPNKEKPTNILPPDDVGRPAKVLLLGYFTRRTWQDLPTFDKIDLDGKGFISPADVQTAYKKVCPDETEENCRAVAERLMSVADVNGDGQVKLEEYLRIFPLPTWMALTAFDDKQKLMSSKNVREEQNTIASLLCNGLRDELEADCTLFDAGSIRGDRDYIPTLGHHRGHEWVFTVADLRRELPFPSEMVVVTMQGADIAKAVSWSRMQHAREISGGPRLRYGGFLQTDDGLTTACSPAWTVTHIGGAPLEDQRTYKVALQHRSLLGMNANPVFARWVEEHGKPQRGLSAETVLLDYFARRAWANMPNFCTLDIDKDGMLSWSELVLCLKNVYFREERAGGTLCAEAMARRIMLISDTDSDGKISKQAYECGPRRHSSRNLSLE